MLVTINNGRMADVVYQDIWVTLQLKEGGGRG